MKLSVLRQYHLGGLLGQVRSVPVRLAGRPENAVLFVYSSQGNIDPWPEIFDYPRDTLKMALFTERGIRMWERDLGPGVIPGVWFAPFISFDLDGDGVDELFWGERLISLEDGHELFCADKGRYRGHSDLVVPFRDPATGSKFLFTCREDHEQEGEPRVIVYNDKGERAWCAVESRGHMHNGWLANIGPDCRKVVMSMRINRVVIDHAIRDIEPTDFYFDAVTGAALPDPLPFKGSEYMTVDFDGDNRHEFYATSGESAGWVRGADGAWLGFLGGEQVRSGKLLDHDGEQMMLFYPQEGVVRIWGDADACDCPAFAARYEGPYHALMQHFMGTGYNHINSHVACGM